jgi:hypothetical protein
MSESIEQKKSVILEHETKLANLIAREVISKPQLSIWMIVIPIVFVYYFYGLNRYSSGKKDFVKHFLFSRRLILDRALAKVETGEEADFKALAIQEMVPENAIKAYKDWAVALSESYARLLESDGVTYDALVKNCYKDEGSYLLNLNQINTTESQFYKALHKDLKQSVTGAGDVIKNMADSLGHLRREEARFIFS